MQDCKENMRSIQPHGRMRLTRRRLGVVIVCIGVLVAAITFAVGHTSATKTGAAAKAAAAKAAAAKAAAAKAAAAKAAAAKAAAATTTTTGRSAATVSANSASIAYRTDYSGGDLLAADPGGGYWTVSGLGVVTPHGGATSFGSVGAIHLNQPIVGMAATPDGNGYWLVAGDGGIFTYGDAKFFGSTGAIVLNKPMIGMADAS